MNMITKKMIVGIKKSDGFLVPNFEVRKGFLSIQTGKESGAGIVVYTGVGLDGNSISQKLLEYGKIKYSWINDAELFDQYLSKIKNLKIGKQYSFVLVEEEPNFEQMK